ncbi:OprD family porin [Pseudomonas sp. NPDC090202]|uniref:OprD family porin n=1 Tax=Pseudomonas sp. NPDC090202 TaxID=3364476 RepID=UPI0037F420D7
MSRIHRFPCRAVITTAALGAAQVVHAGFVEDSKLTVNARNYYYNVDNHEGGNDQREWAQAFKIDYLSGFTEGTVGFGLDLQGMVGIHLDGGKGHHPDNNTFTPSDSDGSAPHEWSSGGATAKMRFSQTELRYGNTLSPSLPILVSSESRLLPQTFGGFMFTSKEIDNLTLTGGQIESARGRASTNSSGLSVAGATRDSNKFRFVGGDWKATKNLTLQYYYANLEDFYKQHFFGLQHVLPINENQSFKTDLRYFKSTSDGANGDVGYLFNNNGGYAKNPGEVDNDTGIATFTYTLYGHSLSLGYQHVSSDGGFVWANQANVVDGRGRNDGEGGSSFYSWTDAVVGNFARAGENTTMAQYAYDFSSAGVPGLKTSVIYMRGEDAKAVNGIGPDTHEWETDMRVDYVVPSGPMKGFGTTLRHGIYRGGGSPIVDTNQTRLIFNYTYAFF